MGLTAIIGDALTDHSAHPFGLYLDGLDVIKEHATPSRFAVPLDSIAVTEAGPGGVSSMTFTLEDPSDAVVFADGARIDYWNFTTNLPVFTGSVQSYAIIDDFGQQGRTYQITAMGPESILDNVVLPTLVVHDTDLDSRSNTIQLPQYIQLVAGFGPLRQAGGDVAAGQAASSQAVPIENYLLGNYFIALIAGTALTLTGLTIRQAVEALIAQFQVPAGSTATVFLTVDFYYGVRAFLWAGSFSGGAAEYPSDYATITLSDTPSGTIAASNIQYEKDASSIVNAVFVQGGAAASTGWVVGDATLGRREASTTTSGTTEAAKQAAALAIISSRGKIAGRGSLDLTDFTPVNAHPGSQLVITDASQGWAAKSFVITEIQKTFHSNGKENWAISFMDPAVSAASAGPPSAARLMRTLTRGTN